MKEPARRQEHPVVLSSTLRQEHEALISTSQPPAPLYTPAFPSKLIKVSTGCFRFKAFPEP
jgi:hypothetical protein